jgi:DNA polymerase-3 subunit epsilon
MGKYLRDGIGGNTINTQRGRNQMASDREKAAVWAKSLFERLDWVIMDTETTGLAYKDEIIQVAILGHDGEPIIDTMVKPTQPIPPESTAVHGITDADVAEAPLFPDVFDRIQEIIAGKTVVIYNSAFDLRLVRQSLAKHYVASHGIEDEQAECAMLWYSAWVGEIWPQGGYKWQKLVGGDHTALGDCRATYRVLERMAEIDKEEL